MEGEELPVKKNRYAHWLICKQEVCSNHHCTVQDWCVCTNQCAVNCFCQIKDCPCDHYHCKCDEGSCQNRVKRAKVTAEPGNKSSIEQEVKVFQYKMHAVPTVMTYVYNNTGIYGKQNHGRGPGCDN